jgi:hypothetical protein
MSDEPHEFLPLDVVESQHRAEIDVAVATAHRFPRDVVKAKKKMLEFATMDIETAISCNYRLERKGRDGEIVVIEGPSIRMAEIALTCWGNMLCGARIIADDGKQLTAQGVARDLESNNTVQREVKRRVTGKNGNRFSEDMIVTTGNAACAIGLRNALLTIIPRAVVDSVAEAAKKVAIGDASTLASRIDTASKKFAAMGVSREMILKYCSKDHIEKVGLEDLERLLGLYTSLRDGATTIDEQWPKTPDVKKPEFKEAEKPASKEKALEELAKMAESVRGATADEPAKNDNLTVVRSSPVEVLKENISKANLTVQAVLTVLHENYLGLKAQMIDELPPKDAETALQNWAWLEAAAKKVQG